MLPPYLSVQIKSYLLHGWVQLVSLLITCRMRYSDYVCTMHAIIRGEHGHAVASLWHRHVPSCGLAIGPRHPPPHTSLLMLDAQKAKVT